VVDQVPSSTAIHATTLITVTVGITNFLGSGDVIHLAAHSATGAEIRNITMNRQTHGKAGKRCYNQVLRGVVTAGIMLLGIQREAQYIAVATTDPTTGERIQPNVLKNPTRNAEFLATQLQSAGYFQLADGQALVLTIDPGDATYFVVPVTNDWTITDDYRDQQTSLNNVQAKAIDGVYTIVISPTDPGVGNWVSTAGLNQGTISIRFQDLPLDPAHLPTVQSQVVPLSQLASVLPAGTIYVTPAERAAQLAARKAGFDNRFAS
jgi:hypothetical protein